MSRSKSPLFSASSPSPGEARLGPHPDGAVRDALRDFSADRRLLGLAAMALIVGTAGAFAAWLLSHLINLVTNLAYFDRTRRHPGVLLFASSAAVEGA